MFTPPGLLLDPLNQNFDLLMDFKYFCKIINQRQGGISILILHFNKIGPNVHILGKLITDDNNKTA
jgi:hypothetical protein